MPAGKGKPALGYRAGKKGSHGCKGFPTVSADGTVHGCHPTKAAAAAQARAIWASVNTKKFDEILQKSMVKEGDFVIVSGEEDVYVGIVEYVMIDGMLGRAGSDYSIEATLEDPAVLVRTLEFEEDEGIWQEEETLIGSASSMLTRIAPLPLEVEVVVDNEVAMAMYDAQVGKAEKPNYANIISERSGKPADGKLYARVIQAAKDKFDTYPSAVANAWVVAEYKRRGGTYKSEQTSKSDGFWNGFLK